MPEPCIRIDSVVKLFGEKRAVDAVSTEVPKGEICGFIGPNGSGKTTTLRMILGILEPDEGRVEVLGSPDARKVNQRVSYLPEERGLYRKMKARHQLEYLGRLKGVPRRELKPRIAEWLERMDLAAVAEQRVETLSKGMSQKLQFIASILNQPELLVLDEPFSGLDPVNRELIRDAILELKASGTTILFSTHDMASAEVFCDRILMLFRGQKVLDGSMEEIQAQYGADTLRLRMKEGRAALDGLVPPEQVRDEGNFQQVRGVDDPQAFLENLSARATVLYFEIAPPRLQDIFVRIARPNDEEAADLAIASAEGGFTTEAAGGQTQ